MAWNVLFVLCVSLEVKLPLGQMVYFTEMVSGTLSRFHADTAVPIDFSTHSQGLDVLATDMEAPSGISITGYEGTDRFKLAVGGSSFIDVTSGLTWDVSENVTSVPNGTVRSVAFTSPTTLAIGFWTNIDQANDLYEHSVGACRGGATPANLAGLVYFSDRNCQSRCNAAQLCSGFSLPVDGSSWCETFTSVGASGNGNQKYECFMKQVDRYRGPGIYHSRIYSSSSISPPVFRAASPCPDGLASPAQDTRYLFFTDICDGAIKTLLLESDDSPTPVLTGLFQPKALAFNGNFDRIFFVANYGIMYSNVSIRDSAWVLTAPMYVISQESAGIVAPIGVVVLSCKGFAEKLYWTDGCSHFIQRSDTNGMQVEQVVSNVQTVIGMAFSCPATTTTTTTSTSTTTTNSSTSRNHTTSTITSTTTTNTTTTTSSTTTTSTTTTTSSNTTTSTTTTTTFTSTNATTTTNTTSTPTTTNATRTTTNTTSSTRTTSTITSTTTTNTTTVTTTNTTITTSTTTSVTSTNRTTKTTTNTTTTTATTTTLTTTNTTTSTTTEPEPGLELENTTTSTTNTTTTRTTTTTNATIITSTNTTTTTNFTTTTHTTTTSTNTTVTTTTTTSTTPTTSITTTNTTSSTSVNTSSTTNITTTTTTSTSTTTSTTTVAVCTCGAALFKMEDYFQVERYESYASAQTSALCTTTTTATTTSTTSTTTLEPTIDGGCVYPTTEDGNFVQSETDPNVWSLNCTSGKMPDLLTGNFVTCEGGSLVPDPTPHCVAITTCDLTNIMELTTGGASGTTCGSSSSISSGTSCQATCAAGENVTGEIMCVGDTLFGMSSCSGDSSLSQVKVHYVNGKIQAVFNSSDPASLQSAFCNAFGLTASCSYVTRASATSSTTRRLVFLDSDAYDAPDAASRSRSLGATSDVHYSVAVPPASDAASQADPYLNVASISSRARDLSVSNSTAEIAFKGTSGVVVSGSITTVIAPTVIPGTLLRDAAGNLHTDSTQQTAAKQADAEDDSSPVVLIIILGSCGVCILGIILGVLIHLWRLDYFSKKHEM